MKKLLIIVFCFSFLLHGMNEQTIDKSSEDLPNLVLDLDDVFLHTPVTNITDTEHQFFLNKSLSVKCDEYHYITPAYLPEFLKFVASKFNITFFSGGDEKRNKSVVQDIWIKVFGVDKPEKIRVLSYKDLTSAARNEELQPKFKKQTWFGNKKKDISKIGGLHNTILVDDDSSYVIKGQERNYLYAPGGNFHNFKWFLECNSKKDKDIYAQKIYEILTSTHWSDSGKIFPFYKLLYVTGLLDKAAEHETSIIDGLYTIQFEHDEPKFYEQNDDLYYFKRGYKVLSEFSGYTLPELFPEIEKHFYDIHEQTTHKVYVFNQPVISQNQTISNTNDQNIPLPEKIITYIEQKKYNELEKIFDDCEQTGDRSDALNNPYGDLVKYLKEKDCLELETLFDNLDNKRSTLKTALMMVYGKRDRHMRWQHSDEHKKHTKRDSNLDEAMSFSSLFNGGGIRRDNSIEIYGTHLVGEDLKYYLKPFLALLQPVLHWQVRTLILQKNNLSTLPDTIGWLKELRVLGFKYNAFKEVPEVIKQFQHLKYLDLDGNKIVELPQWFIERTWDKLTITIDENVHVPWNEKEHSEIHIQKIRKY